MRIFYTGVFVGLLAGSLVSVAVVLAQQYYPESPPWGAPTPQQRFQEQTNKLLLEQYLRQQLQRGLDREPC